MSGLCDGTSDVKVLDRQVCIFVAAVRLCVCSALLYAMSVGYMIRSSCPSAVYPKIGKGGPHENEQYKWQAEIWKKQNVNSLFYCNE